MRVQDVYVVCLGDRHMCVRRCARTGGLGCRLLEYGTAWTGRVNHFLTLSSESCRSSVGKGKYTQLSCDQDRGVLCLGLSVANPRLLYTNRGALYRLFSPRFYENMLWGCFIEKVCEGLTIVFVGGMEQEVQRNT
jgi:hypothetical protein